MAEIEEEISQAASFDEAEIRQLKIKRSGLETRLRQAREAERIYGQAEILRPELAQVAAEGEAKRRERDDVARRVEKFGDIEARLADAESTGSEVLALREERDLIRSRVDEMLQQIEGLNL